MQKPPSNQKRTISDTFQHQPLQKAKSQQLLLTQQQGQKIKFSAQQSPSNTNKLQQLSLLNTQQQKEQEGYLTEKNTLLSSLKKEKSISKILSNAPTYRIAQPSRTNINISSKFWLDTNQNNKGLIKLGPETTKNRPSTGNSGTGMNRTASLPKFFNEKLQNNKQSNENDALQSISDQNQFFSEYNSMENFQDQNLENAAQTLNNKLAFQKAIMSHGQPYQFLSSVGGKQTNIVIDENKNQNKGYNLKAAENSNIQIQLLSAQETLNMYQKIDIDKNMIPQIMIQNRSNKRPQTVSTINKMNIPSMINSVKDQKQIQQISQQQQKQEQLQNIQRELQTEKNEQVKSKKDFAIKKPQSAIQHKQHIQTNKNKLQKSQSPSSYNKYLSSAHSDLMKKIADRNQQILNDMDQEDKDLGIVEDLDDEGQFYEKADQIKQYNKTIERPKSSLTGKRPISSVSIKPNQFFQNFSKYTSFNALEIPYETLFDRNERTLCATFAKFGDLKYYAPVQRIGSYMQFGAKLKLDHLLEIISLQQTITTVERNEFEIPIQLAIIDDLNPFQRKNKTGISTTFNPKDLFREPVTLSIFPEYFENEDENLTVAECADRYFEMMLSEMGGVYDPEYLGKSNYAYIDPAVWPEDIQKKAGSSLARYNHYLNSDLIKSDEIPKFNKEWMSNALELIDSELLQNEELQRQVFQEIFENFKFSMKKAMLDYILRSPQERARLHIVLLPREVLCSGQRITREGGFNIHLFNDWHQFVEQGREKCKQNLVLMNIINSSLQNWYCDFQNFRLMEFQALKKISALGYTLSIQNFIKQQNIYRQNVTTIMRFIWHRGAQLIIKKFKFLRRPNQKPGKWTFCGFKKSNWKKYKEQEEKKQKEKKQKSQKQKNNMDKIVEEQEEEDDQDENAKSFEDDSDVGTPRSLVFLRELNDHFQKEKKSQHNSITDQIQDQSLPAEQVYQTMLQFLIEREFESENQDCFDFYEDINFDELKDIRQNSAYQVIAQKTMEDEDVWKEENGWSLYTKEYKQKILESVGVLMGLQLRSMIENTLEEAEKFFLDFLTLQQMQDLNMSIFRRDDEQDSELIKEGASFSNIKDQDNSIHSKSKSQNISIMQKQDNKTVSQQVIARQNSSFQRQNSSQQQQNTQQSQQQQQQKKQNQSSVNKTSQHQQLVSQQIQQPISINNLEEQEKSLLQQVPKTMSKIEFKKPEILELINNKFNPVLNLEMIIQDEQLKFKETTDFIKQEMSTYIRSLVSTFNLIIHPRSLKVNVDKEHNPQKYMEASKQRKKQRHSLENILNCENNYIDEFDDFYRKFAPFIYLTEKTQKNDAFNIENVNQNQSQQQNAQQQQQQLQQEEKQGSQNDFSNRVVTGMSIMDQQKKKYLSVVNIGEKVFINIENKIISHLLKHFEESALAFQVFDQFKSFITKQADKEMKQIYAKKSNMTNEEFKNFYDMLTKFLDLLIKVPDHVYMPLLDVNCTTVKDELKRNITDYRKKLVSTYQESVIQNLRQITETFNKFSTTIRKSTNTAEEVEFMEKYVQNLISERIRIKHQSNSSFEKVCFLMKMNIDLGEQITELSRDVFQWPDKLDQELQDAEEKHNMERQRLEEKLKEKWFNFDVRSQVHKEELEEFENFSEYSLCQKYVKQIEEFEKVIQSDKELMEEIMDQEKKLYGYNSNFDKFNKILKDFAPIALLWKSISQFIDNKKRWTQGPITELDSAEVEGSIKEFTKVTTKVIGVLPGASIGLRVATKFREEVFEVNKLLPAIEMISRPGIKDRHWEIIAQVLEMPQVNSKEVTLNKLINFNMLQNINKVELIAEGASKEFTLENALDKMDKEWENLSFIIINYKNRGIKVLQGACVEDMQILLDDHTIKAQTIRQNPNVKFMEQRAIKWEELMLYIQAVLDIWIKVQSSFLYLEPIFSYEDINKTLGQESKKFQTVNDTWNMIMEYVDDDPKILHIDRVPNLLKELDHCQELIDEIQKGLEQHLENKRLDFPRFFFLSNDDLITILAETRDPLLVQPHMKKCFEGIMELIFNNNADIIGIKSSEGEEITLVERIQVRNFKSNVEQWLLKVEEQMVLSLSKIMEDSLQDLKSNRQKKNDWVRRWPGQIILAANQLTWTEYCEEKLFKGEGVQGMSRLHHEIEQNIEKIVNLVRGQLNQMETLTLGALIVLEVHNIDVVKTMIDDKITDINAFEWLSQMRYNWIQENGKIQVKMMTTTLNYGYEYLGNSPRLVITPLTDRCYRTLMSALQLNLGGAPEGPAGTGKTETTKDLGKAIAIQCVVFNCSDGLKIDAMAKFFKGLITAGAWSCFDEFNRIELEVLSVIAQQIRQIQDAKASSKIQLIFHGTDLTIKYSCNIFITMNPGYAGRSELPDNLKTLFRPVAMMVPDYAMIAEISLYSYGFVNARDQARKIVAVYKLCSEQLSSQDHYDYGMRAVKAVLTTAQQIKRKFQNEREEHLILRSICDVNLPKFLQQDIQLFQGIISDLYPNIKIPNPEYGSLNLAISTIISDRGLQNVTNFRKKILQLYEVINTRHGVMLVGQPYSGKSECYKVLAGAMTLARKQGDVNEYLTNYYIINPKSITLDTLYGYADSVSKEWTEGILAEIYRKCATNRAMERQIIVFDGPVDADWIENMNTVLDDNKKLCLMNGETILMTQYMTMLFEVQDLKQASPATVSRCGMVYLQPEQLGWAPLFQSWLQSIAPKLDEHMVQHIDELFDALVNNVLQYTQGKCKEYQTVHETGKVVCLMKFFKKFYVEKFKPEQLSIKLDMLFLYSCMWSLGGTYDEKGRDLFHKYFKNLMRETTKCPSKKDKVIRFDRQSVIPEGGSKIQVFDYFIEQSEFKWKKWQEHLEQNDMIIQDNIQYNQIVISTVEMLRITDFLQRSIQQQNPVLLMGPTGVGKSTYINKYIKGLPLAQFNIINVNFSAQSTSTKTQEIIDSRLDKRRKGIYGPKLGIKCIVFVDDTNMPAYDKYEAQPPIELLRQLMDHKGWYGKDRKFREIIDTLLITAMGPPGGGRNFISPRFLRHFSVISTVENSEEQLNRIFQKLMQWHLRVNEFSKQYYDRYLQCVSAAVSLYLVVIENLKPTPSKSHYQFNQRDLSRCVQGMMLLNQSQLKNDKTPELKIIRLWVHESCRVFFDRLVFDADNNQFYNDMLTVMRKDLKEDIKMLVKDVYGNYKMNLLTCDPLKVIRFGELLGEIDERDRPYQEITVLDRIYPKLDYFNEDFNTNSKKPMNLIFFEYALDNILKLCRLLKMQQSHALLVGLGGSGRQSLAMLSSHIRELPLFQIDSNKNYGKENWMEDMQKVMIQAGAEHREIVFLMSDAQIKQSFILEDINNMLNNGDIPQIFPMEEFSLQIEKMRSHAKKLGMTQLYEQGTSAQFYDFFVECVKQKLHIIIALSSVGNTLRNRIRMFPNLINCTTCIWYKDWPEDALQAVALKFTADLGLENHIQRKIMQICKKMHQGALDLAHYYQRLENKINYITPSSYLELLNNLSTMLQNQRKKLEGKKNVYKNGVLQILKTQQYVKQMETQLNEKKPVLVSMNEQTTKIAQEIQGQAKSMEPKKLQVQQEEKLVNERVQEAEKIKEECEKDLSVAKPKLIKAMKALDTLDVNDINNLKAMLQPPNTVKLVLEAVCILCKVPPERVPNPKAPKERILDYWEASKKFMSQKDFLQRLKEYDKDNIDAQVMQRVRQNYVSQTKDFNPTRVEKASSAAKGMCEWILALDEYEKVLTVVRPKQIRYNQSKEEVERLQQSLQKTRDELTALNKQIQFLENQYETYRLKQKQLQDEIIDCEKKLKRAANLITSLGGEQERWGITSSDLENKLEMCNGDVTISIGIISYLGPFTQVYRNKIIKEWLEFAKTINLQVRQNFSLESTLGEAIVTRKWCMNGLPSDIFSIDNGIITYNTKRWPLMIDPQNQAFKWIKPNEEYDGFKVVLAKQTDQSFQRTLENAIQFGQVLILENTKEEIDSLLEPVLQKQTFKAGGVLSIKIGDNIIDFGKTFKLYFTCKLRNPHFTPEISTRVTIVNFTITKEGLEDQLLELCVRKEVPDDAELKSKLIVQSHENKKQLDEIEQKILDVLNKAESILDDEKAVNILQSSKTLSLEIEEKQRYAEETEQRIEISRQSYKQIAVQSTVLFFTVMDISKLNIMYQYSLDWFIQLYLESFDKSKKNQDIKERIKNVNDFFKLTLFNNVCRSLFEKDKLLFSFLLLISLLEQKQYLDRDEFKFFIQPVQSDAESAKNETQKSLNTQENEQQQQNQISNWLPNIIWEKFLVLAKLSHKFSKIKNCLNNYSEQWKQIYYAQNANELKFPEPFNSLTQMQRLCILKILRPDKVINAIRDFIKEELGDRFTNPLPFNMQLSYNDSNPSQPLIFILPGTDPIATLTSFSEQKNKFLKAISLGSGQGIHAEKAIEEAKTTGSWVMLQNCHLAPSWMPRLEKIVEDLQLQYIIQNNKNDSIKKEKLLHNGFRLWLTTYSSTEFPNSILENSIKMTNEPPQGLKSNMIVSYTNDLISDQNFFENHPKPQQFKTLLYGLCLFHAVIQERRNFGPLGWNIYYDFNQSDLRISARQLHIFLSEYETIPFKALHYLVGECNYGGRVTDDKDRRILHALMREFFSDNIFGQNFKFAGDQNYPVPKIGNYDQYIKNINDIPSIQYASMFGFNENGDIVKDIKQTNDLCDALVQVWSSQVKSDIKDSMDDALSVSDKQDQNLKQICEDLLKKIPKKFDFSVAEAKYPVDYKNSMNTVLLQEIIRYNNLVNIITKSLRDIQQALQGIVVLSEALETASQSITKCLVPLLWKKNSYPSLKPLAGYIADLARRLKHYHQWIDVKPPSIHWISGFYFTQAYFTAILQNFARKYQISIDNLTFNFYFYEEPDINFLEDQAQLIQINEGSLMYGLYLEGCQWDFQNQKLKESAAKVLYTQAPIIWLKPIEIINSVEPKHYKCPVYKTQERKGVLSTTGHSTNFIIYLSLPTDQEEAHWIKRGVAMICSISE